MMDGLLFVTFELIGPDTGTPPMSNSTPEIETSITTKTREKADTRTRKIPPHNLILHNDDHHSMEFVIETLIKAMGFNEQRATLMTLEAHQSGRAIIWTGTKEVAE